MESDIETLGLLFECTEHDSQQSFTDHFISPINQAIIWTFHAGFHFHRQTKKKTCCNNANEINLAASYGTIVKTRHRCHNIVPVILLECKRAVAVCAT